MSERPWLVLTAVLLVLGLAPTASAEMITIQTSGIASQESTYSASYPASKGNDGDYATNVNTARDHMSPWWEVNLGTANTRIDEVFIHYGDPARVRPRAYNLTCTIYNVDNTAVYTSGVFHPWNGVLPYPTAYDVFGPWKIVLANPVQANRVVVSKVGYHDLPQLADEVMDFREYEVRRDDGLTGENVAQDAPVTVFGDNYWVNGDSNCAPANLTDGTIGTHCHSDVSVPVDGEYGYRIDMGSLYDSLTQIKVYPRQVISHVGGGASANRLGDYVVSLHDDDNGSIGAMNWSATKAGIFTGGLGTADVFTAASGAGTFKGQWIQIKTTATGLAYCSSYTLQIGEVRAFVPEPSTLVLLAGGLLGMMLCRRK